MTEALTSDYDQGCETGEGGNIQLHAMEGLRKLQDGVNPVPEASDTLRFVKHSPVAEDELVRFRIGTSEEKTTLFIHFILNSPVLHVSVLLSPESVFLWEAALTDMRDAR